MLGIIELLLCIAPDMSSLHPRKVCAQTSVAENLHQVPQTFAESIAHIKTLALRDFDREIVEKQLCYHTREHVEGVQRRASQIFQVVCPYFPASEDCNRLELLLDLCAVTHDLIQIFVPQIEPNTTRRREAGVSETATIARLFGYINLFNQQCPDCSARFSESDLQIIKEAIAATICDYDPTEQAIFQPALYEQPCISSVARILALADIGTLGMEGIEAYNTEGSLLFLEENLDVRSLIENHQIQNLASENSELLENIRQRLLRRARFQVNFAKSRLRRYPQELQRFPLAAIPVLRNEVFQYLTVETIRAIEATTPTADDTSLKILMTFFQFDQVLNNTTPGKH